MVSLFLKCSGSSICSGRPGSIGCVVGGLEGNLGGLSAGQYCGDWALGGLGSAESSGETSCEGHGAGMLCLCFDHAFACFGNKCVLARGWGCDGHGISGSKETGDEDLDRKSVV